MDDQPLPAMSAYPIDFDNLDMDMNPFVSKTKIGNSPPVSDKPIKPGFQHSLDSKSEQTVLNNNNIGENDSVNQDIENNIPRKPDENKPANKTFKKKPGSVDRKFRPPVKPNFNKEMTSDIQVFIPPPKSAAPPPADQDVLPTNSTDILTSTDGELNSKDNAVKMDEINLSISAVDSSNNKKEDQQDLTKSDLSKPDLNIRDSSKSDLKEPVLNEPRINKLDLSDIDYNKQGADIANDGSDKLNTTESTDTFLSDIFKRKLHFADNTPVKASASLTSDAVNDVPLQISAKIEAPLNGASLGLENAQPKDSVAVSAKVDLETNNNKKMADAMILADASNLEKDLAPVSHQNKKNTYNEGDTDRDGEKKITVKNLPVHVKSKETIENLNDKVDEDLSMDKLKAFGTPAPSFDPERIINAKNVSTRLANSDDKPSAAMAKEDASSAPVVEIIEPGTQPVDGCVNIDNKVQNSSGKFKLPSSNRTLTKSSTVSSFKVTALPVVENASKLVDQSLDETIVAENTSGLDGSYLGKNKTIEMSTLIVDEEDGKEQKSNASSIPDDEFKDASAFFNDPDAWDKLAKFGINTENKESDLARQSLFVKFDPLIEKHSDHHENLVNQTLAEMTQDVDSDDLLLMRTPPVDGSYLSFRRPNSSLGNTTNDTTTLDTTLANAELDRLLLCSPSTGQQNSIDNRGAAKFSQVELSHLLTQERLALQESFKQKEKELNLKLRMARKKNEEIVEENENSKKKKVPTATLR